jgi:hypothetical protein
LPEASRLTDSEREQVHARLDELTQERRARVAKHIARLWRNGEQLGKQVAAHEMTLTDAYAAFDRQAAQQDPESPVPLFIVPYAIASEILREAFAKGFGGS